MVKFLSFLLVASLPCFGGTYYIDYESGDDGNAGTSTGAAWKRSPYMQGFTGSYSHNAGDQFVFKGGVSWPASCFPLSPPGGSSGAWDRYESDGAFYSGASFSKPRFDITGTTINNLSGASVVILSGDYNVINGIVFTNLTWDGAGGGFGNLVINALSYGNVMVTNCDFVGMSAVNGYGSERLYIICSGTSPTRKNIKVSHCNFTALPLGDAAGTAGYYAESFDHCTFHDMFSGHVGYCTNASFNSYYNLNSSDAEPASHPNACYVMAPAGGFSVIEGNVFSNCVSEVIYPTLWLVGSGQTADYYILNNLIADSPNGNKAIECDPEPDGNGTRGRLFVWNNTIVPGASGTTPIRIQLRTGASFAVASIINNHIVSDAATMIDADTAQGLSVTNTTNLEQSTATAATAGYVSARYYAPQSADSATVNAGTDLSAYFATDILGTARGAAWDIGAYEYGGSTPEPQPSGGSKANRAHIKNLRIR